MNDIKNQKTALVLGGGGFIGGHLAKRLKEDGYWVRVADIKPRHEFFEDDEICNDYASADLRLADSVASVLQAPSLGDERNSKTAFDEVYQLAADMGGAGYIFTGENDANVMHNSALINLHTAFYASKFNAKRVFYSSSACMYPAYNQLDPNNPNCEESSAYPAAPDSEYGWEKLFSERLFLSFERNYQLNVRIARFHNIFGPQGTWDGGKEKAPAAMCRKAAYSDDEIEVWGDGQQTRSFLYIDDCVEAILRFMRQDTFAGPVNIGSEEMVTINELAELAIKLSGKDIQINNIDGQDFQNKYGFPCPIGVRGRNSDNRLFKEKVGWEPSQPLSVGMKKTFCWIESLINSRD